MIKPDYLRIGKVLGAHGLDGRVKVYVITDIPSRFAQGNIVYGFRRGTYEAMTVSAFSPQKGRLAIIAFDGVNSRTDAEPLKGVELFIEGATASRNHAQLDEDSFYYYEIIGMAVYHHEQEFGRVTDILEAGCGNILIVTRLDGRECMIPFVEKMVDTSRLAQNRIDIHPVDGLFDIET